MRSAMYERLKRLYDEGRLSEAGLQKAVDRGWITQEEFDEIVGKNENTETEQTDEEEQQTE